MTSVFTNPNSDDPSSEIDWNIGVSMIPGGSIIVGTLHNHPDISGINDTIPSYSDVRTNSRGTDWLSYDSIIGFNSNGITTDPNLLMYIYSNEDHNTHVYDKNDHNTTTTSCGLK